MNRLKNKLGLLNPKKLNFSKDSLD